MGVEAVIATQVIDTTTVGRSLMTAADAAAARTALSLGTLATQSGTFSGTSSGTNTGDQTTISGNAGSATFLQTARTINGVSFDGSANITVTAAGSTLSDTVTVAKGGTGLTALGTALQVLRVNAGATALEYATASGGTPGGSSGQVQYNNAGAFGGMTAVIYATTGTLLTATSQAASDVPFCAKGAASQSGNLIEARSSANALLFYVASSGAIVTVSNISLASQITFNDTVIRRTSAGVLEINNGTAGTLRDLALRNFALNSATFSAGGGVGIAFIANATTVPTTNPTGGGILYCEGGALKFRGSSGTVTTLGPA